MVVRARVRVRMTAVPGERGRGGEGRVTGMRWWVVREVLEMRWIWAVVGADMVGVGA